MKVKHKAKGTSKRIFKIRNQVTTELLKRFFIHKTFIKVFPNT